MVLPAKALRDKGCDVREGLENLPVRREGLEMRITYAAPIEADVAVFQRMANRDAATCVRCWQSQGTAVVVDVDDLLSAIPKNNPAWETFNARVEHWRYIDEVCAVADLVTVSTPALAEYYGRFHGRVRLLRNCVPDRFLEVERVENERPVLGWAGNVATHRDDLKVAGTAPGIVVQRSRATFLAIGDPRILSTLRVPGECVPWQALEEYPKILARLDVGMVPLHDSPFNRAKSALKGLDYAACGVAFVASPLPEYRELAAMGIGLLADGRRQWEGRLRRLLTDRPYRDELADSGREAVRQLAYSRMAEQWWSAWEQALENRRRRAKVA